MDAMPQEPDPLLRRVQEKRLARKIAERRAARGSSSEFSDVDGGGSSSAATPATGAGRTLDQPDESGYGMLANLGRKVGIGLRGAVKGTGDIASVLSTGLGPVNQLTTGPLIDKYADFLTQPLPSPESGGERLLESATRGGVGTGGVGGPLGILSGVTGGVSAQGVKEIGGGPLAQVVAGTLGGMGPGLLRRAAMRNDPMARASGIVERTQKADVGGPIPNDPNDRVRQALSLRVAGQGGSPANRLGNAADATLGVYADKTNRIKDATTQEVRGIQRQGRTAARAGTDAVQTTRMAARDETARLRDVERQTVDARRTQADARVAEALRGATGDRVADAVERAAGIPRATLKQMTTQAEEGLRQTGKEAFGALDDMEFPPSERNRALYDAFGDPNEGGLIREAYEVYAPKIEHTPRFQELQKAYQLLGARAREAARNGGALKNGTLMADLYAARDRLGTALEEASDQFRGANAQYRARAAVVDGLHDGMVDSGKAKAADIADRLRRLREVGGEDAAAAYRIGLGRGTIDRLREMPTSRDAATRVAAAGSDEAARLRMAFPDDTSYEQFVASLDDATGNVTSARTAGAASVAAVGPEFAARRAAVRGRSLEEVKRIAKDVRATQDQARLSAEQARDRGRETLRGAVPAKDVKDMREITGRARTLDVPERGRPLKGAMELGVGAKARGSIDLLYGLFGKKTDPEDVRQLLVDYLLAQPDGAAEIAGRMRGAASARRQAIPLGALLGANAGGAE